MDITDSIIDTQWSYGYIYRNPRHRLAGQVEQLCTWLKRKCG